MTTCAQALKNWEIANNIPAEEAEYVKLYCQQPPIMKMDASLNTLKNCERLALSTNCIDRIIPLTGMSRLKILSLGRNQIKKIEKLEDVAGRVRFEYHSLAAIYCTCIGTLEELWISYNQIATLDGLSGLTNLTTLYISNNLIKQWSELDKLVIPLVYNHQTQRFRPISLSFVMFFLWAIRCTRTALPAQQGLKFLSDFLRLLK